MAALVYNVKKLLLRPFEVSPSAYFRGGFECDKISLQLLYTKEKEGTNNRQLSSRCQGDGPSGFLEWPDEVLGGRTQPCH